MKKSSHIKTCAFYEIVEAPYDSHWLLEMVDAEENDELTRSLRFGRPLPTYSPPLMFTISTDGKPMDFSFTAMGIMVVSEKAEEVLRRKAGSDIQLIPAIVKPLQGRFSVAQVVTKLDCVDQERSSMVQLEGPSGGSISEPEYVLDPSRVGAHQIFRLDDDELIHIITHKLRTAIEDADLVGPPLLPLDGSGDLITPGVDRNSSHED